MRHGPPPLRTFWPADVKEGLGARDLMVAIGAFLVVSAVLTRVLVSDAFAETVPSSTTVTRATAEGATVLDARTGRVDTGVALARTTRVAPVSPPAPGLDAYIVSTSVQRSDQTFVSRHRWSAVQQPVTGVAIASPFNTEQVTRFDANGNTAEVRRPLRTLGGVVLRFGRDTAPVDQPRWDPTTGTVAVAAFVRRTTLAGSEVLEFRQRGTGRASGTTGDLSAESDTTVWVRPETGAVVKQEERLVVRLATGQVALDASFIDDPRDVQAASDRVDRLVRARAVTAVAAPATILLLGVLFLVAAGVEGSQRRLTRRWRREPIGATAGLSTPDAPTDR